jgi:hypothetical protein
MTNMTRRDRVTIGLLGFFLLAAATIELYFLVCHADLPARTHTQLFARALRLYSTADRAYYDPVSPLALAFEGLNVFFMQPLCLLLMYAIIRKRAYRWPLQLAIGAYLAISVLLYYTVGVISGYDGMPVRTTNAYLLFYGANLPWMLAYGWLAFDAGAVISRVFAVDKPALATTAPFAVDRLRVPDVDEAPIAVARASDSDAPSSTHSR